MSADTSRKVQWTDRAHTVLVERDGEVAALRDHVDRLRRFGRSGLVTVAGRRGVGLSAVLRVAVQQARAANVTVATARCSPVEMDIPFGVVSQLNADLADAHPMPRFGGPSRTPAGGLCTAFLAAARRQPLVLAVDDVQWADTESLEWLQAMSRRVHQAPMLIVRSVFTAADGPAGGDWLLTDGPRESARVLWLRPLREPGVDRMIRSRYDGTVDREFVEGATEATGGSPVVLRAVLGHFRRQSLPPSAALTPTFAAQAAVVIGERETDAVDALPRDALTLLRVVALCGDTLGYDLAATLAGPRAADSVGLLARLGLVVGESRRTASQVVAAHALAGMTTEEQSALATSALELGYRAAVADDQLATLLLAAPAARVPWAAGVLRRVAARRRLDGAHRAAAALLTRALREPATGVDHHRLRIELSMAEVAFRPEASDRRLHQVLLDSGSGVPGQLLVEAADLMHARGDVGGVHRAIATACERATGDIVSCASVGSLAAIGMLAENERAAAPVLPVPAFPALAADPADPVQAATAAWLLTIEGRDRGRARALARTALPAGAPGDLDGALGPRVYAARVLKHAGEIAEAVLGLDRVLAAARRRGAQVSAAVAYVHRAGCELARRNPGKAAEDLEAARAQLPTESWHPSMLPALVAVEAALMLAAGEPDRAAATAATELPAGADVGVGWACLLFERGRAALALGEPASGLRYLEDSGRTLLTRGWLNPVLLPWREHVARAHQALGDGAAAFPFAWEAHELATAWGTPSAVESTRRLLASLADSGAER